MSLDGNTRHQVAREEIEANLWAQAESDARKRVRGEALRPLPPLFDEPGAQNLKAYMEDHLPALLHNDIEAYRKTAEELEKFQAQKQAHENRQEAGTAHRGQLKRQGDARARLARDNGRMLFRTFFYGLAMFTVTIGDIGFSAAAGISQDRESGPLVTLQHWLIAVVGVVVIGIAVELNIARRLSNEDTGTAIEKVLGVSSAVLGLAAVCGLAYQRCVAGGSVDGMQLLTNGMVIFVMSAFGAAFFHCARMNEKARKRVLLDLGAAEASVLELTASEKNWQEAEQQRAHAGRASARAEKQIKEIPERAVKMLKKDPRLNQLIASAAQTLVRQANEPGAPHPARPYQAGPGEDRLYNTTRHNGTDGHTPFVRNGE